MIYWFGNGFFFRRPWHLFPYSTVSYTFPSKCMVEYPLIIDVINGCNVIYFRRDFYKYYENFLHSSDAIYYGLVQSNRSSQLCLTLYSRKVIKVNLCISPAQRSLFYIHTDYGIFVYTFYPSVSSTRSDGKKCVQKPNKGKKSQTKEEEKKQFYLPHGQTY